MSKEILLYDDVSWFKSLRENLLNEWQTKTVVASSAGDVETMACSILQAVKRATGHLSLACSLQSEAEQIEKLLNTTCFDDDPVVFFRLLLFLLDEFTARMQEFYGLLGKHNAPKQPILISIWTNRYAKHRTAILIQHHAQHLFEDEPRFAAAMTSLHARGKTTFVDTAWLKASPSVDLASANQDQQAVVIVPRQIEFLKDAIQYFSDFRGYACSNSKALEQFQSPHHWNPLDLINPKS